MNTANRRLAAANLQKTRRAAGWTKRTTWFDPASSAKLEALKQAIGSYDEAIRQAIMGWEGPQFVGQMVDVTAEELRAKYPDAPKRTKAKAAAPSTFRPHPKPGKK